MADELEQPVDEAGQAQAARETAAKHWANQSSLVSQPSEDAPPEEDFSVLPSDREQINNGAVDLGERFRLNRVHSFYTGTLAGSGRLAAMAHFVNTPDDEKVAPEMKKARDNLRGEYGTIVADLSRYDMLRPWSTTTEGAVALGGALTGGLSSPESFVGVGAKGATWLGRTVKAAFQQGAIQTVVDPAVQYLNNQAGTEDGYDPVRTVVAGGMGLIIGGGLHGIGEAVSAARVKGIRAELAKEDPSFSGDVERSYMTAYHGSPHDFEKFDVSKIGEGEGAQAYGHGLYFAENEAVARDYKQRLSRDEQQVSEKAWNDPDLGPRLTEARGAYDIAEQKLADAANQGDSAAIGDVQKEVGDALRVWEAVRDEAAKKHPPGAVYKVRINAPPEHFLDWDKPFSEQSEHVKAAVRTLVEKSPEKDWFEYRGLDNLTGEEIYDALARTDAKLTDQQKATAALSEAGVRGIKYLDQGSRVAPDADVGRARQAVVDLEKSLRRRPDDAIVEKDLKSAREHLAEMETNGRTQTRNVVVFDDKHVDILDKNGKPIEKFDRLPSDDAAGGEQIAALMPEGEQALAAKPTLVVARKMPDGEVKYGEPGQVHTDLMTRAELKTDVTPPDIDASMGYALPDGKFLTRGEALEFAAKHEPQRAAHSMEQPELGLEAASYLNEPQALAARQGGGALPMERARPDEGVPTETRSDTGTNVATVPEAEASPAQDAAIKSLQQQAMDFAKALDFPLRGGRVPKKGALGTFNPGTGVVRVREVPDFEVVAHEGGHFIEKKIGVDLTDLTDQFHAELAPLVSNPAAYKPEQYVQEGFAEYIRRYIGNPAHAQQIAPGFSTAFRNFMEQRAPEMLKAIDSAAESYQAYLRAPSVDVVGSVLRSMTDDPAGFKGVIKSIRDRGLPATISNMVQSAYTKVLDDKAPVARAVRDMAAAIRDQDPNHALVNLKAADNPEVLLRLAGRSQQAAIRDMMDGTYAYHSTTPEGPSLTDALAHATGSPTRMGKWDEGKRQAFSTYLIARRAEYLWRKHEAGDLANPPASFSKGDAATAMAELERGNPNFREAGDMVRVYTAKQLQKAWAAGLIDKDLALRLLNEEFYVPFMRDMSDKPLAAEKPGSSPEGPGMTSIVKKMKGSSRDIIDPVESMMMQTFLLNRTIQHNDVIRSFVRLSEQAGASGGRYVEKLPANEARKYTFDLAQAIENKARQKGMSPDEAKVLAASMSDMFGEDPLVGSFFKMEPASKRGEPIVFYKEGGDLKAARFMSESEGAALYETVTAMPTKLTDAWSELIASTSSVLRTGIITNPSFAVTNYIRDQVAAAILRTDYVPIYSGIKGIAAEFGQNEAAKLYGVGGGVAPGASIAMVERAVEADVNALAKKGYLVNRVSSFKGILDLASFTEAGTRNSVFSKVFEAKKAQGLNDYESMIEAAFQATDLMDFSRHGSRTLAIRNYIPFLNAHFQGLDKAYRAMVAPIVDKIRDDQVFASDPANVNNAVAAWVKAGGAGMILGAGWAAINSESEAYRDASTIIKGTHVVVPFGNKIFLWPKPFELGIGFTAGEYAYQRWAQDDPRAAEQFLKAAWQSLEPPNPMGDIPAIKTYFELKTGKNTFTGSDIVPDRLARLPAAQQYTDRTSSLAKFIGSTINISPMKIDHTVGSMFGNWGRDVMTLSSGVDESAPAANWEDYVFLRRLIKDPTRTSDVTTKFWGFMGQTTGTYNQAVSGYDNLVKLHDDAHASEFLGNLAPRERAFVIMKSAADEDGKASFKADEKRLHPLQRAYDAVGVLNGLRRDLVDNNVSRWENKEPIKLNAASRRDLIENVRELAQMEMRNAFVIMKEPGYANRPLFDTAPTLEKVRAIAPSVAEEIATRYATAKIFTTKSVATAYPTFERALLIEGSEADLGDLAADAQAEGYEFGGERVKKPQKRRTQIQPGAAP